LKTCPSAASLVRVRVRVRGRVRVRVRVSVRVRVLRILSSQDRPILASGAVVRW